MTLLVYCAWETRVMRNNVMGKKAALCALVDLQATILGGLCSGQFGWPTQQLNSVDIRQLSMVEADELRQKGFFHWYSVDQFTQEQLEWIMSGHVVRHTFGIFDVDAWQVEEVFEMIED